MTDVSQKKTKKHLLFTLQVKMSAEKSLKNVPEVIKSKSHNSLLTELKQHTRKSVCLFPVGWGKEYFELACSVQLTC